MPLEYRVKRVREGRSFIVRQVEVVQHSRVVFTVTISFMRQDPKVQKTLNHARSLPTNALAKLDSITRGTPATSQNRELSVTELKGITGTAPFVEERVGIENGQFFPS